MTCTYTSTLGVYLLGALEPEERSQFEGHLARCDVCRSELVRLAPLPGLLNQITLADFDDTGELTRPVTGPSGADERAPVATLAAPVVLDPPVPPEPDPEPEPEPRRQFGRPPAAVPRRWTMVAAASAVFGLTAGGIVAYEALRTPGGQTEGIVWAGTNPTNGVHAEARMITRDWGTEIQISMANLPVGASCRLVVFAKGTGGYKETAGWWAVPPGTEPDQPHAEIPGSTSIALAMISRIEVVTEDQELLIGIHRP